MISESRGPGTTECSWETRPRAFGQEDAEALVTVPLQGHGLNVQEEKCFFLFIKPDICAKGLEAQQNAPRLQMKMSHDPKWSSQQCLDSMLCNICFDEYVLLETQEFNTLSKIILYNKCICVS